MQTRKRAKPVKFNPKAKPEKEVKSAVKSDSESPVVPDEAEVKQPEADNVADHKESGKGLEAHFSSTIETVDLTETIPSEEPEGSQAPDIEEKEVESDKESVEKAEEGDVPVETTDESSGGQDVEFFNAPPDDYERKKGNLSYFFKVALMTFVLGLIFFAGVYYALSQKNIKSILTPQKEPTATPTRVAEKPTPVPVDLGAYNIKVLNGTDISGLAAKLKTELTDAGFKVISTGNADKQDYEKTVIASTKKVSKAYLDKLKETLQKKYVLGSPSVLASGEADVVVTVGSASAK